MSNETLPAAIGARIEPGVGRLEPERAETQLGVHWLGGRPYMLTRDAQAEKQPAVNTWPQPVRCEICQWRGRRLTPRRAPCPACGSRVEFS